MNQAALQHQFVESLFQMVPNREEKARKTALIPEFVIIG
jgi:hypothetical protein